MDVLNNMLLTQAGDTNENLAVMNDKNYEEVMRIVDVLNKNFEKIYKKYSVFVRKMNAASRDIGYNLFGDFPKCF